MTPCATPASGQRSIPSPPLASLRHGSALLVLQPAARGSNADTCLASLDLGPGRYPDRHATPGFDLDDHLVDEEEDEDDEDYEEQDDEGDEEEDEDESDGDEPETWQVIPLTSLRETA